MSRRSPAVIGKRGIEDSRKRCWPVAVRGGSNVGDAAGEVLKGLRVSQPAVTEHVEVSGVNFPIKKNAVQVIQFRAKSGVASDQGAI